MSLCVFRAASTLPFAIGAVMILLLQPIKSRTDAMIINLGGKLFFKLFKKF
jgi:hypothetical protein